MGLRSLLLGTIVCVLNFCSIAQTNITFSPLLNGNLMVLNDSTSSTKIEMLRFYISNLKFVNSGTIVWQEENSYHLLDASFKESLSFQMTTPSNIKYNELHFTLGIDSITHENGAMGGDLDPTKGMYWSWQSGYINFKIEGQHHFTNSQSSAFQLHLGGYKNGFTSAQNITLKTDNNNINVAINLNAILNSIVTEKAKIILSPSKLAQRISKITASSFYILPSN